MLSLKWSKLKSDRLKLVRGVSFEEVITGKFVDLTDNPSRKNQKMFLFEYKNYIWLVPCIVGENEIFLKTLYPSRKYTKIFRRKEKNNETN